MKRLKSIVVTVVTVGLFTIAAWFLCGFMTGIDQTHNQTSMTETALTIRNNGKVVADRTYEVSFSNGETWQVYRQYVMYDGYVYLIEWDMNSQDLITFQNITTYNTLDIEA